MKKLVLATSIALLLSACSSVDPYQQRANQERERQAQVVKTTIKQAPSWFTKRPKNNADVVYGVGFATSNNMMMAMSIAENEAYSQLCMGAGAQTESQFKNYTIDRNGDANSQSTKATRTRCPSLDITGAEVVESETIPNGARFNQYVLVALPLGDANSRARARDQIRMVRETAARFDAEFQEMDKNKQ
jgi:hypothetical protein